MNHRSQILRISDRSTLQNQRTFEAPATEKAEIRGSAFGAISATPCAHMLGEGKRFVYILRSGADPARHYVGITDDVDVRLKWHNEGPRGYTTSFRPWSIVVSIEFPDEGAARRFERYLKTGSGRAFAKRHFAQT